MCAGNQRPIDIRYIGKILCLQSPAFLQSSVASMQDRHEISIEVQFGQVILFTSELLTFEQRKSFSPKYD